jgi:hypothetical protein
MLAAVGLALTPVEEQPRTEGEVAGRVDDGLAIGPAQTGAQELALHRANPRGGER